ncbi:DUF6153 family protein [Streptomyces sp. NPDC018833]|uniref:DUF6153 family protein n=1 Tax=Streptomyces sp. NPDC018833 TaxID=3365053 RepID=UPI003788ECF8
MSRQGRHAAQPHGARAYLLLVLAVLAGVLAMHGLGPAFASPAPPHSTAAAASDHVTATSAASHTAVTACEDCIHAGHGGTGTGGHADHSGTGTGGHAEHADATCAAGGTSTAPALPALALAGVADRATADMASFAPTAHVGGRAPPTLSELQLLRI